MSQTTGEIALTRNQQEAMTLVEGIGALVNGHYPDVILLALQSLLYIFVHQENGMDLNAVLEFLASTSEMLVECNTAQTH